MRNKLLVAMALCSATSSTLPLWASENWPDPALTFVDPALTPDENGGGVYYVYHVATRKFMCDGNWKNNWGTELIVAEEGKKVTLSYGQDYELSRRPVTDGSYNDAYGWRMSMMEGKTNSKLHEFYIPSELVLCVDHDKQGHILWKIVKQDNGAYRIKIADEDPLYGESSQYAGCYIGINEGDFGVNPLVIEGTEGVVNPQYDWKFVEPDAYDIYQTKKKLQVQLDAADAANFKDITDYADLYKSEKATVEELEKAIEDLKADILDFKYGSASASNPIDVTELIVNPSFTDNEDGWEKWRETTSEQDNFSRKTGSTRTASDGTEISNFFERWNPSSPQKDWSITQDLTNLPDGKYRLKAYIMCQINEGDSQAEGRYLYARTLLGESRQKAEISQNQIFTPFTLDFSVVGGTATVGFRVEGANSQWTAVDNFSLQFLGKEGATTLHDVLKQNITDAEAKYTEYTNANETFSKAGQQKYEETLKVAQEAADNPQLDNETLMGIITSVQLRMDTLALDIAAYKTLQDKTTELENAYDESPYSEVGLPLYEDYLDGLLDGYSQRTFDPNEVDSIQPRADRILKEAVAESLKSPDGIRDATGLFTNMSFAKGTNGWTKSGSGQFSSKSNRIVEIWNAKESDSEVHQELTGLPEGSYKITMQGYYSPSIANSNSWKENWGTEGDTSNDILGFLTANDASVKLHHIMDEPIEESELPGTDGYEQIVWTEDPQYKGKWLTSNSITSADMFEADETCYLNTAVCYVGQDGKLRIGVKVEGSAISWGGSRVFFDNFKVEYLGAEDMTGALSAINSLIQDATNMLNQDALTTAEAKEGLSQAIEEAQKAVEAGLTLESYTEQAASLNEAIEKARKSTEAANKLEALAIYHEGKFMGSGDYSYEQFVGTPEFDTFKTLITETMPVAIENLQSMDEIERLTAEITEAYNKMVATSIDVSEATINSPADMTALLQSPSFSELDGEGTEVGSIRGWTSNGNQSATSAKNFEFYNLKEADIHQTVYGLPKGYYRLSFDGFYRAGDLTPAALSRREGQEPLNAQVYAEAGEGKWNEPLASIFDGMGEYKYTTSDQVLPDSLFPESKALYHIVVNNVTGADLAFQDDLYASDFAFYVSETGQPVTIGVRKDSLITNDWTIFDNFTLVYYGDGDANKPDDFESAIGGVISDGKATIVSSAWYTLNGIRVEEPKQRGIYIRQDLMSDGSRKAVKVMVR